MNEQSMGQPTTTLADFLRTGKLGELALGMEAEALFGYAGLPDGIESVEGFYASYRNRLQSKDIALPYVAFLYDNIEVWLVDYKISRMQFEVAYLVYDELRPVLKFDWMETVFQMNTEDFRHYVHKHQIACDFIREPWLEADGNPYIPLYISSSDVFVVINLEDGADNVYSFSLDIRGYPYIKDTREPW